jgi:hypothetical protein
MVDVNGSACTHHLSFTNCCIFGIRNLTTCLVLPLAEKTKIIFSVFAPLIGASI